MKNEIIKDIADKIGINKFLIFIRSRQGKDVTWLRIKKEVLHIEKHIRWLNAVLDRELLKIEKKNEKTLD
jgi:hypothetical protein